jgi:hypothetical protein
MNDYTVPRNICWQEEARPHARQIAAEENRFLKKAVPVAEILATQFKRAS